MPDPVPMLNTGAAATDAGEKAVRRLKFQDVFLVIRDELIEHFKGEGMPNEAVDWYRRVNRHTQSFCIATAHPPIAAEFESQCPRRQIEQRDVSRRFGRDHEGPRADGRRVLQCRCLGMVC